MAFGIIIIVAAAAIVIAGLVVMVMRWKTIVGVARNRPEPAFTIRWSSSPGFRPEPAHWPLAAVAIYSVSAGRPWDVFAFSQPASETRDYLASMWDVHDRASLMIQVRDLQTRGRESSDHAAWDLVRVVNLAQSAAHAGYLPASEAQTLMLETAAWLQGRYGDWSQLASSFLHGRRLWVAENPEMAASQIATQQIVDLLNADARSPWKHVPWALALAR